MKTALRGALLALLCLAGGAGAQSNVLATLPAGFGEAQALEAARQVLAARGWTAQIGGNAIEAGKANSEMRIFVRGNALRFTDLSERPRAERLRQLQSLLDRGLITPQEYEQKRAEIFKEL